MQPRSVHEPDDPKPTSNIDPRKIKHRRTYTHVFSSETIRDFSGPKLVKCYVHTFDLEIDPDSDLSSADCSMSTEILFVTHSHFDSPIEILLARFEPRSGQSAALESYCDALVQYIMRPDTCHACLSRMHWVAAWGDYDCPGAH